MENAGRFLACVMLLGLAFIGSGSRVDARKWSVPAGDDVNRPMNLSGNAIQPMNLSGNSAGKRFEVSTWNVPYEKAADQSTNLSGIAVRPMNLSGNAVQPVTLSGDAVQPINLSGNAVQPVTLSGDAVQPMNLSGNVVQPMNLSGNSVGSRFEDSTWNFPYKTQVDLPTNLSGNSLGPRFLGQGGDKSASLIEEQLGVHVSVQHSFDTLNGMENDVEVRCEHGVPDPEPPLVVDQAVHPGEKSTWLLDVIDPGKAHVRYQCIWAIPFSDLYIKRTAWADSNHQADMPLACAHCVWKVQDDGIYLANGNNEPFTFVSRWCTAGYVC